mmetsp:Transcript_47468/g.133561  ORF Transcript_47468/g.133561 Transcript_47468/m.133561 type:complete len:225 (-) Transcript_47468:616-1290(-)
MNDALVVRVDMPWGQQGPRLVHADLHNLQVLDGCSLHLPMRTTRGGDVTVLTHPMYGVRDLQLRLVQVLQRRIRACAGEVVLRQVVGVRCGAERRRGVAQGEVVDLGAQAAREHAKAELRGRHDRHQDHGRRHAHEAEARQLAALASPGTLRGGVLRDAHGHRDRRAADDDENCGHSQAPSHQAPGEDGLGIEDGDLLGNLLQGALKAAHRLDVAGNMADDAVH